MSNQITPFPLSGEEIAAALTGLGEDATADRVLQIQRFIGDYPVDAPGVAAHDAATRTVDRALKAEALGFESLRQCEEHVAATAARKAAHAHAKTYQRSPEAEAQKAAMAVAYGMKPEQITWVEPPLTVPENVAIYLAPDAFEAGSPARSGWLRATSQRVNGWAVVDTEPHRVGLVKGNHLVTFEPSDDEHRTNRNEKRPPAMTPEVKAAALTTAIAWAKTHDTMPVGKLKVKEAEGAQLDWMVSQIDGMSGFNRATTSPDAVRALLDRERIVVTEHRPDHSYFLAEASPSKELASGRTFEEAGLRCLVASKLGREIQIPAVIAATDPQPLPPTHLQSLEDFRRNVVVVNVHKHEDALRGFAIGRAEIAAKAGENERQYQALLDMFEAELPGYGGLLLAGFEQTLTNARFTSEVFHVDRSKAGGKSIILNAMLVTPEDIVTRVYDHAIHNAIERGEPVFVGESAEDPRDALLARRSRTQKDGAPSLDM